MQSPNDQPKLYRELATWWPALSAPEAYAEEAAFYWNLIVSSCAAPPKTLLELGSGGGNNASHLKQRARLTLVDLSPDMLAVSRALNPECEHHQGDMRTVRLGREFGAVFVHDAIVYLLSLEELRQAVETAYLHCRPGGVALFAPDFIREAFRSQTEHGGHDLPDRALRYLQWTWDPDPADNTYLMEFAYLLREPDRQVRCEQDRHLCGLFSRAEWLQTIAAAGFQPQSVPFEHSEVEPGTTEVFLGLKSPRTS
jgi:SAM-dependent methyltransferase